MAIKNVVSVVFSIFLLFISMPLIFDIVSWCFEPVIEWYIQFLRDFPDVPENIEGCYRMPFLYFSYVIIREVNNDKRRCIKQD